MSSENFQNALLALEKYHLFIVQGLTSHQKFVEIGPPEFQTGPLLIPYLDKGNYSLITDKEIELWKINQSCFFHNVSIPKKPKVYVTPNFNLSECEEADFVSINMLFPHFTVRQIASFLADIKQILNPKSLVVIDYIEGNEDCNNTFSERLDGLYKYHVGTIKNISEAAGFDFYPVASMNFGELNFGFLKT